MSWVSIGTQSLTTVSSLLQSRVTLTILLPTPTIFLLDSTPPETLASSWGLCCCQHKLPGKFSSASFIYPKMNSPHDLPLSLLHPALPRDRLPCVSIPGPPLEALCHDFRISTLRLSFKGVFWVSGNSLSQV